MMQQSRHDSHEKVMFILLLLVDTLLGTIAAGTLVGQSMSVAMGGVIPGQTRGIVASALLLLLAAGDVFAVGLSLASGALLWMRQPRGWQLGILGQGMLLLLVIGSIGAGSGDASQFATVIAVEVTLLYAVRSRTVLNRNVVGY